MTPKNWIFAVIRCITSLFTRATGIDAGDHEFNLPAHASDCAGTCPTHPAGATAMRAKNIIPVSILGVAAITADANGASVDLIAFEGDVKFTLESDNGGGADHTLDVKLQHSDDDATFVDIAGGAFTQVTNAAAAYESIILSGNALKKYVRGVDDVAGTSPTFSRALSMVGEKKYS